MHCLDWVVVVVAALVPFLAALGWGRRLAASTSNGESHSSERWMAYTRSLVKLGSISAMVAVVVAPRFTLAILLLSVLFGAAGTLPARRAMLGQSWAIGPFLSYVLRFQIGLWAPWMLLAAGPSAIMATASWHPAAAVAFVVLVALVSHGFSRLWPRIMEASPVEAPAITARFQTILARSPILAGGSPPVLLRAAPAGGTWTEAAALPHPRHARVVISDTLLQKLDIDELGALFAHRIARLEHYQGKGLFLRALLRWLLPASVGLIAVFTVGSEPVHGPLLYFAWILAVQGAFSATMARNGRAELAADCRAIELCGDPDALVRALTKLHALANLPSRWDAETEQAVHPGLASRIRAIREGGGVQAPALSEEIVLTSSERGRFAILGPEQICFLDAVTEGDADASALRQRAGSSRSFAYRSLSELHLAVAIGGRTTLRASTRDGQQVHLPLAEGSVKLARNTLDAVDGKVGRAAASHGRVKLQAVLAASVVMVAAMLPGMPGPLVLLTFLALLRPGVAPMIGTGAAAVVSGALALLAALQGPVEPLAVLGVAAALIGGAYLLLAARRLSRSLPEATWRNYRESVLLLTALTVVSYPFALKQALSPFEGGESMSSAGAPLAIALALLILARYRARLAGKLAGGLLLLAALAPAFLGSDTFQRLSGNPALGRDAPTVRSTTAQLVGRTVTVPPNVQITQLSPTGQRFIGELTEEDDTSDGLRKSSTFVIGNGAGEVQRVRAVALTFITDRRVLAITEDAGGFRAVELGADGSPGAWQAPFPAVHQIRLAATETRFRVIGQPATDRRAFVMIEGEMGRSDVITTCAPATPANTYRTDWIPSTAGGSSLSILVQPGRRSYGPFGRGPRTSLLLHPADAPPRMILETSARIECPDLPLGPGASTWYLCLATERRGSVLLSIGPNARQATALVRLPFREHGEVSRADSNALHPLARGLPAARRERDGAEPARAAGARPPAARPLGRRSGGHPAPHDGADGGDDLPALSRHPFASRFERAVPGTWRASRATAVVVVQRAWPSARCARPGPHPHPLPQAGEGERSRVGPRFWEVGCSVGYSAYPSRIIIVQELVAEITGFPRKLGPGYRRNMEPTWTIDALPSMTTSASSTSPSE